MEPPPKKRRGLWSLQQLKAAMAAVQKGLMSQRAAAARYSIPRRTLVNHLNTGKVYKKLGRRSVLTAQQEKDLASRIKRLAAVGFPLTPKVIRQQAYIFCERHEIPNNFNQGTKRAGKDWLKLFLKRNPDISKRKAQILNPGRAQKLNKPIVMQHFGEYKKIYEELEIGDHPERLYNMDEKGCRLTIHNQPMVLAQKGVKRVHMVAPEHAENVTVAACVNALGSPIPPMVLFKGVRMKPEFTDDLPAGSLVKMAPKGSMTSTLFIEFIRHLGKYKAIGKCLLVFDGASCHLDYRIVEAADEQDIVLYCLPSNTTHELQPLDKSVNKSFEHHWDEELLLYLYQNPDKKLTKSRFNTIFSRVWSKCMTHQNIVSGFRATGLYPYNPQAVPVEAFLPSVLTERPPITESSTGIQRLVTYSSSDSAKSHLSAEFRTSVTTRLPLVSSESDSPINEEFITRPIFRTSVKTRLPLVSSQSDSPINEEFITRPIFRTSVKTRLPLVSSQSDSPINEEFITRPIFRTSVKTRLPLVSSQSDSPINEEFITRPIFQSRCLTNIYECSSTDDESTGPLPKQKHTPSKQQYALNGNNNFRRQDGNNSTTSNDSDVNVQLERSKTPNNAKSTFQELIPTPNYAVLKQNKPRRKAINYKARIVTKDLFTDRGNNIMAKKQQQIKQNVNKKTTEVTLSKAVTGNEEENNYIASNDKWYCYACCTEKYEDMRQCPKCKKWYHEECLGLTKADVNFECIFCD